MRLVFTACWLAFIGSLSAQTNPGSLAGTVSDPNGASKADAPIQLTNKVTGTVARTSSDPAGRYVFAGLAPGMYQLTIVMPCCAYRTITKDVLVETGQTTPLNISLSETVNGTTLGDDPGRLAAAIRKRAKVPSRPVPRDAAGKPDLSGVWVAIDDPYPENPEPLPWAAAVVKERRENHFKDAPHNHCLPGPPPVPASAAPFIAKFVQTSSLLVILLEDVPGFRQVFLDQRTHPADGNPTWLGHSLGKWDGEVLVVDTVGFNDRSWIGGLGDGYLPHTEMLHLIEKYRRVDFGHMELTVTFDDPGALAKPFHMNVKLNLAAGEELLEYVCENNRPEHLVGK